MNRMLVSDLQRALAPAPNVVPADDARQPERWFRVYSDDVDGIPNLAIYTYPCTDGAYRDFVVVGCHGTNGEPLTDADVAVLLEAPDGAWISTLSFQRGDPRSRWNGWSSTGLLEVIKLHLASFTSPAFAHSEALPGSRWSVLALYSLESAGNYLRQRLRFRVRAGAFGPPGSPSGRDTLGNELRARIVAQEPKP